MKTLLVTAAVASVLMLASPGESLAQRAGNGSYRLNYDAQTIWTVSGEVISLDNVMSGRAGYHGIHLLLKTVNGNLSVHLGPSWYMDGQTLKVGPHDRIEVTGSPVIYDGKPALIAADLRKDGENLQLRTAGGIPLWSRSGAR